MKFKILGFIFLILIFSAYFSVKSLSQVNQRILENDFIIENYEKINKYHKKVKSIQEQAELVNENVKKTSIEVVDKIARVKDYTSNVLTQEEYPTFFINASEPVFEAKISTLFINQNIPQKNWRLSINIDKLSSEKFTITKDLIHLKSSSGQKNLKIKEGNPLIIECGCDETISSLKIDPIIKIVNVPNIYKGVYTGKINWNFEIF